jgi:uncharacterized protein (UPF0303 family)
MSLQQDIDRVALQEERLQFTGFDAGDAWTVGTRLRAVAEQRLLPVAIDIQVSGHPVFLTMMPGATPNNLDWIRRKRNVVVRYERSSYAIGLQLQRDQTTLTEQVGVEARDYAAHGGCFPIRVRGTGFIGSIGVSGLPQRADHELIVEVLTGVLGEPLADLALGAEGA